MGATGDKAVVLLSGGLDSATTLAVCRGQGYRAYALTLRYGQRHALELESARRIACAGGVEQHLVADLDPRLFVGSALTGGPSVPKDRGLDAIARQEVPVTYVPGRNTVFLGCAMSWAETMGAGHVFIGVNAQDYSGYPDCRPEYVEAFQRMTDIGTKAAAQDHAGIRVHAPIVGMTKAQIIRTGLDLGVDYSVTTTCYDPPRDGVGCGRCDACLLRRKGFEDAGATDPLRYA